MTVPVFHKTSKTVRIDPLPEHYLCLLKLLHILHLELLAKHLKFGETDNWVANGMDADEIQTYLTFDPGSNCFTIESLSGLSTKL